MTDAYDPERPPVALTVAGSDSGGGAGIQADLKTMTAHGVFGTAAVTATTAQNTAGVHDVQPLPPDHVASQIRAVVDDFPVASVKTGMLATADIVERVTDELRVLDAPLVVDPVMVAATGDRLLTPEAESAYADLISAATLVTPNADEAAVLTGQDVSDAESAAAAGADLVASGADAALVKGGHLGGDTVVDTLVVAGGTEPRRFTAPRIADAGTHGSGCVLSSAIAARLAHGQSLPDAAEATTEMTEVIRRGYDVGSGDGAVNPTVFQFSPDRRP